MSRNATTKRGDTMTAKRTWLLEYRGDKTQQEVADKAGIERSYYTQIENGDRNPSVDTAKKIATALDFNWTIFFEDECGVSEQPLPATP
jgi:putative transcriptional regulator